MHSQDAYKGYTHQGSGYEEQSKEALTFKKTTVSRAFRSQTKVSIAELFGTIQNQV